MRALATALVAILILSGCAHIPKIKLPGVGSVAAFKDAGTPAEMSEATEKTGMRIPKNSKVKVRKTEELKKEGVLLPAFTEWEFELTEPTDFVAEARQIMASTGTIDTTVAAKRIDAQERRPLLYFAIGCILAGFVFMYLRFQAVAVMSFMGAGAFFFAWKVSEISPWVGALFIVAAVAGFAFYKRAEFDANGDGVPDFLQKK